MGRFIAIGLTRQRSVPYVWVPRETEPRFVRVGTPAPAPEKRPALPVPAPVPAPVPVKPVVFRPVPVPEPVAPPVPIAPAPPPPPPAPVVPTPPPAPAPRTPLAVNLFSIRKVLGLTPEEFARPIIEDGEGIINRLEAGLSRPSEEIASLICETWGLRKEYLYTGRGDMFLKDDTANYEKHLILLAALLKQYLSVATFDKKGVQYWKGSLVTDLSRIIDIKKLDGRGMSRVIRVLFDYLDVDQFAEILEKFGE